MGVEPASVRASVRPSTTSDMNISATSRPIGMKFYLKHHWGRGKAASNFGAVGFRSSGASCSKYR